MTGKNARIAICLIILLIWGVLPARAQVQYEQKEETVSPKALFQFQKGERLAQNDKFEEAIAAYRQALRIQPKYAQASLQMGLAYARLNQYPEAVKAFKEAIRLQPQWGLAHENLGVAYIKMGHWQDARDAFLEAVRLHPNDAEAHYNLGLAYGKLRPGPGSPGPVCRSHPPATRHGQGSQEPGAGLHQSGSHG